ncbi:hypothetical protein IEQ34_023725 [Dendrobium chrysotoxum]|uniref:Ribosomal protein S19 n=1 Tax=Dendrobium chrysotoxum TaxID=161865 RepID=A0AAV7FVF0_DENCH|nr:hypothetical protein IEQ34_023725 [Dendrobium chrysotoxum]
MPRRSIWKGSFVDAFLLRMKKNRESLLAGKFGHVDLLFRRNSLIAPYSFTMEKLLFVVGSLKERLVINLESLLYTETKTFENK